MSNSQDSKPSKKGALRGSILMNAHDATMRQRHEIYGDPYTDMNCAAEFEEVFKKHAGDKYCPAHNEAMRRVFCKLARIACGVTGHHDSYVDLAAYIAIAAECQEVYEAGLRAQGIAIAALTDELGKLPNLGVNEGKFQSAKQNIDASSAELKPSERWQDADFSKSAVASVPPLKGLEGTKADGDRLAEIERPQPVGSITEVKEGLRFKVHGNPDVWTITRLIMSSLNTFAARCGNKEEMFHIRAIAEIVP